MRPSCGPALLGGRVRAEVTFESDDYETVQGLVAAGVGVASSRGSRRPGPRGNRDRELAPRSPVRKVIAATVAAPASSPAAKTMIGSLPMSPGSTSMPTERRLSFGGVAELYEDARPSYPEELVDEVLRFSGAAPREISRSGGRRDGQGDQAVARRGCWIVAIEPSGEMAAVARRACAHFPQVRIEQAEFERWPAPKTKFALVFSAQAWHWISPDVRYARARAVLRPGGALAAFWNTPTGNQPRSATSCRRRTRDSPPTWGGRGSGTDAPGERDATRMVGRLVGRAREAPGFGESRARGTAGASATRRTPTCGCCGRTPTTSSSARASSRCWPGSARCSTVTAAA